MRVGRWLTEPGSRTHMVEGDSQLHKAVLMHGMSMHTREHAYTHTHTPNKLNVYKDAYVEKK